MRCSKYHAVSITYAVDAPVTTYHILPIKIPLNTMIGIVKL